MAEEMASTEEETAAASLEERNGSGHGFMLGVVLGGLAGAAAATLFAPAAGEEIRHRLTEEAAPIFKQQEGAGEGEGGSEAPRPGSPVERVRGVLTRVRSRLQKASEEGQQAAQEAEEESRARYAELSHQEESRP